MPSEAPMQPCPTDDQLGALVEHALDEIEAARVSSHIDGCDICREIVIAAVRGDARRDEAPALAKGTPSLPSLIETREPKSLVGTRMGRYEIKSLLGAGGMGQVFTAYDAELDRNVALKVLRPELAKTASVLADRLVRESRLMARVAHPAVITVYDVGREGDAVFIAMELVHGETLAAFVHRAKPDWREVVTIFERAGQGLAAAHDAGIVHRDFKPENVLVESAGAGLGRVIVTDFGIATAALGGDLSPMPTPRGERQNNPRLTATGMAIGTPAYMAPEQLGGGSVDRRADIFAFCVSMWEALFGERPFRGKTADEIRAAMNEPPRVPNVGVPNRLVRALERGLAVNPTERWPEMSGLLRELAAVGSKRKRVIAFAALAGVGLVGAGIAGALAMTGGDTDKCALRDVPSAAGLGLDAPALKKLDDTIAAWRATHTATCHADRDPVQAPTVAVCLAARRLEIDAVIDDARRLGAKAGPLALRIVGDPTACKEPTAGMAFARVPADAAQRRVVSNLRLQAFDVEQERDRAEYAVALPKAKRLVHESASAWPPVQAELLYLLGTTESQGGETKQSGITLRAAAALAERVHHDYIAANCWIQLIQAAAFDAGEPERAIEYATYADAALDRIGRPPLIEVLFLYYKGTALVELDRSKDAEPLLRRAVELAEQKAPSELSRAILGLGYLFEEQGRYDEAVTAYRRAIALFAKDPTQVTSAHTFRERLAINLSLLGKAEEAETTAREAVAIAERTLGEDNVDRSIVRTTLAQVLQNHGKNEQALVEARLGARGIARILGERNERYGEVLSLEGNILVNLERFDEGNKVLERACEIIAFGVGDDTTAHAECLLSQTIALDGLGRSKDALPIVDHAIAILLRTDGEIHPRVASALVQRAALRDIVGRKDEAIADFEKAIAAFEQLALEPGHLGGAKWGLGRTLWTRDKVRAKKLIEEAIALFETGSESWAPSKADALAWLHTH